MRVGHQRHVLEETWQARDISQHRLFFDAEFVVGPREYVVFSATDW